MRIGSKKTLFYLLFSISMARPGRACYLDTFQPASMVIGQPDFTSVALNQGTSASASTLASPYAVWSDGTRILISESFNNRVLLYNSIPTTPGAPADVVIGQPNFTSAMGNYPAYVCNASNLNAPVGVWSDGTRIVIADSGNHRVLIFNSFPGSNYPAADLVIGQPDLVSGYNNRGTVNQAANSLEWPRHVSSDGTRLYIGDSDNDRILIYNSIPTVNDASADMVLGQSTMSMPDELPSFGYYRTPTASTFAQPWGAFSDGVRLFVGDSFNRRVLVYNALPTANGQAADAVLGQPNFGVGNAYEFPSTPVLPDRWMSGGASIQVIGSRLFASDGLGIKIFDTIPTTTYPAATRVLGYPGFGLPPTSPSASQFKGGAYAHYAGGKLFVADQQGNRVLIFNCDAPWPTVTTTSTHSATPSETPSATATPSVTPSNTASGTLTPTQADTPYPTSSETPSAPPTLTHSPMATASSTASPSPSAAPSLTSSVTLAITGTSTLTPVAAVASSTQSPAPSPTCTATPQDTPVSGPSPALTTTPPGCLPSISSALSAPNPTNNVDATQICLSLGCAADKITFELFTSSMTSVVQWQVSTATPAGPGCWPLPTGLGLANGTYFIQCVAHTGSQSDSAIASLVVLQ